MAELLTCLRRGDRLVVYVGVVSTTLDHEYLQQRDGEGVDDDDTYRVRRQQQQQMQR